jgi:FAD/FMN-containing dehydrogenase
MNDLSRRELLALSAAAAGTIALPGFDAGSAAAAVSLTGRVVRPGDPAYELARTDWDMLFSHYPQAIVFCRNARDVANAIAWARRHDIAVRARSGRHNLEGWSNIDGGLVVDVSQIKGVAIDRAARTATIGAGLTQGEVVAALGREGVAIPTGTEASVGIVGATLGGGFGFLTRALGLASDNLLSSGIVVPAGRRAAKRIVAGPHTHADLLWACRGGGGGNFGIVTSLTYRVHPVKNVAFVVSKWPDFGSLRRVVDAWQRTAPHADRRLTSVLEVDPSSFVLYAVMIGGTEADARRHLSPVLSIGNPRVSVSVDSWANVFASFNSGPRQYANWKFYSQFVTRPFPARAIDTVRQFMQAAPSPPSNFFCSSFGGAVAHEPPGGSAFAHRDALFYAEPGAGWNGSDLNTKCQAWVAEFGNALSPFVDGAYVNVPNAATADWPEAYYGSKYSRLRRIKAHYDPTNFFQFEQSVQPG